MKMSTNSSDEELIVSRVHLSVVTHHYTWPTITLESHTSCNVTCTSPSPGHAVQLLRKHSSVGGLQIISAKLWLRVVTSCSKFMSIVKSFNFTPKSTNLTIWRIVHTQTKCVPEPKCKISFIWSGYLAQLCLCAILCNVKP
jgi:hypothetical protein